MTAPLGKLRTREHILADLSINWVERQVLLCGHSVDRVQHDYGYDLIMATYSAAGEIEPGAVYIQVKATDQLPILADGKALSWPVDRRDLKLWLAEAYPVILIVYDGQKEKAYWLHVQPHLADVDMAALFAGGGTVRVHIPIRRRLNPQAVRAIATAKNDIHQRLRGKGT
jgi:hypothetical protein